MKLWVIYSPDAARDHCVFGVYDTKVAAEVARTRLVNFCAQDGYGWMRFSILDRELNQNRG